MAQDTVMKRASGLPAEGSEAHYFGFDQQGNIWALAWSKDLKGWTGAGYRGGVPAVMFFTGPAADEIASHIEVPLSELPDGAVLSESVHDE